jgi:hypothetical protein
LIPVVPVLAVVFRVVAFFATVLLVVFGLAMIFSSLKTIFHFLRK